MAPKIALLGDVMLGRGVAQELASRDPAELWSPELRSLARSCDAVICNLECCVSERGHRTERLPGKPFFFRAPPSAVESLTAIGVRIAGLANNHALDFETEALADSLDHLKGAGIAAIGAGLGTEAARRGTVIEAGGLRLGVVAAADHPAEYAAGDDSWGIAYADLPQRSPEWLLAELGRLDETCDVTLAFLHWGPNMTTSPAPWQRAVAQELIGAGADVVAGHSAHVFHGVGSRSHRPLLYDLGDAVDDYAIDKTLRNDLGVIAIWTPGEAVVELVGLRLHYCFTDLARGGDAEWISARLERACIEVGGRVERVEEGRFRVSPAI